MEVFPTFLLLCIWTAQETFCKSLNYTDTDNMFRDKSNWEIRKLPTIRSGPGAEESEMIYNNPGLDNIVATSSWKLWFQEFYLLLQEMLAEEKAKWSWCGQRTLRLKSALEMGRETLSICKRWPASKEKTFPAFTPAPSTMIPSLRLQLMAAKAGKRCL